MENKEITLEQIDLVMERAKVSYSDAKEALEATNGDLLEALIWLEKNQKVGGTGTSKNESDFGAKVNNFVDKLNHTRFKMFKKETTYVNVPLSIALIITLCTLHVSIFVLLVCLIGGVKVQLEGDNDIADKVNETIKKAQL